MKSIKKVYPERGRRVFVGLSGGVDSAVSAGLLKQQGYEVTGVFIKAWSPEWMECTWKEDRRSAMRACAVLDIPFVTLDLEEEYKRDVVDYMVREYKAGRTPNPDVMCNKEIKFGAFLKFALEQGADFVATGHYAQASPLAPLQRKGEKILETLPFGEGRVGLLEGKDKNKDQSYFLWTLNQEQLKHILFPVGDLLKPEVRKLAEKFKLPQATRKDSQGLCFLGQVDMKEFLKHYIEPKVGNVLAENGVVIGEHNGALFFTLGERHGFHVTHKNYAGTSMYVVGKNVEKNEIIVKSQKLRVESQKNRFNLTEVNLLTNLPISCEARFRYRQDKLKCKINHDFSVEFENLEEEPAKGQSVVFYRGEICLGGGVIQ